MFALKGGSMDESGVREWVQVRVRSHVHARLSGLQKKMQSRQEARAGRGMQKDGVSLSDVIEDVLRRLTRRRKGGKKKGGQSGDD